MSERSVGRYLENNCFLAIVIATLIITASLFTTSPNSEPRQAAAQEKTESTATEQKKPESTWEFWTKTTTDPVAAYTGVLAVFTLALVCVSAIQIYFLIRSDKTARITAEAALASNNQTRDLFIAETRPWLNLSDPEIHISDDMNEVYFTIKADNIGKTPAKLAEVRIKVMRSEITVPGSSAIINFCSSMKEGSQRIGHQRAVFPETCCRLKAINDTKINTVGKGGDFFRLVYCATYQAMDSANFFRSGGEILFKISDVGNFARPLYDTSVKGRFRPVHFTSNSGVTFAD
jgi:hypothetical protein